MTRKDLIIIAVLANIGVLAIIFMLAFRIDDEKEIESANPQISYTLQHEAVQPQPREEIEFIANKPEPTDEVDSALEDLGPIGSTRTYQEDDVSEDAKQEDQNSNDNDANYTEITIKRGDALEKIARANGTTVEAIKVTNKLKTDRLKIGQVLRVPIGTKNTVAETKPAPQIQAPSEGEYYTIKSGDNPWKIAKQFHLKVDELLRMNDLDEDKARNLKIGDQIRVR
jgi:peptidoglycan endopeptidase LytF